MPKRPEVRYEQVSPEILRAILPPLTPRQLLSLRTQVPLRTMAALRGATWVHIDASQKETLEAKLPEILGGPGPKPLLVPVYYDYMSQNSWLAVPVCERLGAAYHVLFDWRGFEQRPEWKPLEPPISKEVLAARWEESRKVAKSLGVPLAETRPPFRFRTLRLLMCAEYAKLVGRFWPFHLALLEAFYGHHKDISQVAVVDGIAERVGIHPEAMEATVESGRFLGILDQYRWEAARAGVFGVPTFIIDGQLVWGRQTLEEVEEALKQAGVEKKKGGG